MKCLIVLMCAANCFLEQAITTEQAIEMYPKIVEDCAKKESGSQDDIDEILRAELSKATNGKCTLACVGETTGMMKDNKVSVDGANAVAKIFLDEDTETIEMVKNLINDCVEVTDVDRCEAAFKLALCYEQASKARGYDY